MQERVLAHDDFADGGSVWEWGYSAETVDYIVAESAEVVLGRVEVNFAGRSFGWQVVFNCDRGRYADSVDVKK